MWVSQLYLESWPTTTSFSSTKMHLKVGKGRAPGIVFTYFSTQVTQVVVGHYILCLCCAIIVNDGVCTTVLHISSHCMHHVKMFCLKLDCKFGTTSPHYLIGQLASDRPKELLHSVSVQVSPYCQRARRQATYALRFRTQRHFRM